MKYRLSLERFDSSEAFKYSSFEFLSRVRIFFSTVMYSEEADKIKAQAKSELDQEVVKARNELRDQVSTLVMQGVNSVLDKEVDSKTHKDMLSKLSQSL